MEQVSISTQGRDFRWKVFTTGEEEEVLNGEGKGRREGECVWNRK